MNINQKNKKRGALNNGCLKTNNNDKIKDFKFTQIIKIKSTQNYSAFVFGFPIFFVASRISSN